MSDKAILFGVNQYRRISNLRGCVNDVKNLQALLADVFGFSADNVRTRTDDKVTKKEIEKQWKWLLNGASVGDRLVFHFSGHGSYTRDEDGDEEEDGVDELLCLYGMDWGDRESYLLDDDLRKMTESIPAGVHVTFLLDSCHSGTGTRVLEAPDDAGEIDLAKRPVVDVETSVARLAVRRGARSLALNDEETPAEIQRALAPHSAADAERTVLARFVPPPPEIARRLRKAGVRRPLISMRDDGMNHVLFSGSRSDQTSADAYIQTDFHGAFTYYFCKAVSETGDRAERQDLIHKIREELRAERFSQIPQLEPEQTRGPLFGARGEAAPPGAEGERPPDAAGEKEELFLALLQRIVELLESRRETAATARPAATARHLVYVHGICRHEAGYSKVWWTALRPHLAATLGSELGGNHHEVLWSEIVSPTRVFAGVRDIGIPAEERALADSIRDILEDRAERQVVEQIAEQPRGARPVAARVAVDRAALGVPGLNCVDDFAKYLLNDSIRDEVLDAFLSVVEPLLRSGAALELISHSWGTVVAYEGLRRLDGSALAGSVHTLFTVGSALSIGPVRRGLLTSDGARPACVRQWINLDAKGDIVGGLLDPHGFAVDAEYIRLHPTGCASFAGIVAPSCAHGSYFVSENRAVNSDVFGRHIQR